MQSLCSSFSSRESTSFPKNFVIRKDIYAQNTGFVEEWSKTITLPVSKVRVLPIKELQTTFPKFSYQLFVGKPGKGKVCIGNHDHLNMWLTSLQNITDANPKYSSKRDIKLEAYAELGHVSVENDIHELRVDHDHHFDRMGTCVHKHRVWYSPDVPVEVSTCSCPKVQSYSLS